MNQAENPEHAVVELLAAAAVGKSRPYAWALLASDLTLVDASAVFQSVAGLDDTVVLGRSISGLLWEFVGAEEALLQVLKGERPALRLENVCRAVAGDGEGERERYLTFQVTAIQPAAEAAVEANGRSEQLLLLVEDSSELGQMQQKLVQDRNELRLARRQLEEANASLRQLNRQKSLYLAMAAHDLRTPLTSIQGFTDLVRHDLPEGWLEQQQMLDFVCAQADKLQRIIADLLDLEIIEQGRLTIRRRECVLNDLLYQVLAALGPAMALQELELETNIPDEPLVLWADPARLEQIIYNLVGNALKYSPSGGKVSVAAARQEEGLTFRVTNEGRALTKAQIRRLFDAYYRTEQAQNSHSPGSGLGLYIVKTLVETHGGDVDVRSNEGIGNEFSVHLPTGGPGDGANNGR